MWHVRILSLQLLVLATIDDGIHKEAARIARHLGIRQLGIADVDDHLAQLFGSRLTDASTLQLATDIAILRGLLALVVRQAINDMSNEVFVLPLVFEAAVAIAILTLLAREHTQATRTNLYRLDRDYQVLDLGTIGTDVLHGAGSNLARYQREVLSTIKLMTNAPGNDLVPHFTTAAANIRIILSLNTFQRRVHHRTIKVGSEQEVAASTYQQIRRLELSGYLLSLLHGAVFHEATTLGIDAKRVVRKQAIIFFVNH